MATKSDPPLIDLKVTNPVTYIKLWWKKILGNEGIDIRFRIRPFTAILIVLILVGSGFGLGRFTLPKTSPLVQYLPQLIESPVPTPNLWKEKAFTGIVRYAAEKYYLTTSEAEAVTLEAPRNVNLSKLIGKRILAVGIYNTDSQVLRVTNASDLEVLIQSAPVPTTTALPTNTPLPTSL